MKLFSYLYLLLAILTWTFILMVGGSYESTFEYDTSLWYSPTTMDGIEQIGFLMFYLFAYPFERDILSVLINFVLYYFIIISYWYGIKKLSNQLKKFALITTFLILWLFLLNLAYFRLIDEWRIPFQILTYTFGFLAFVYLVKEIHEFYKTFQKFNVWVVLSSVYTLGMGLAFAYVSILFFNLFPPRLNGQCEVNNHHYYAYDEGFLRTKIVTYRKYEYLPFLYHAKLHQKDEYKCYKPLYWRE